jgi:arylsulfatase A-like enzyme
VRRRLLPLACALLAAALPAGCGRQRTPDVILVTLDTTRSDHLGVYGYRRPITPSIDRFARDSVTYRRAWSTAPWTLPAHASIFTGKRPGSHGADQGLARDHGSLGSATSPEFLAALLPHELPEQETTLAELLDAQGYESGAFVGGPYLLPEFGLLQGYRHRDTDLPRDAKRRADELADRAIAWLETIPRERPVNLLVNFFDPHAPYAPPAGYDDLPGAKTPIRVTDVDVMRGAALSEEQRAASVDRYDGEIRFMDFHLGRLLAALERLGRYDGAIIVLVGDHGELFGEHGLMEHGQALYEELIRVPLIVHFPHAHDAGRFEDRTVSTIDLLPLVAAELGLALPAGVEGVPVGEREVAHAECSRGAWFVARYGDDFDRDLQAVVRWPWKLILSDRGVVEAYRLDEDPAEAINRRDAPEAASLLQALEAERATLAPRDRRSRPAEITPEVQARLRALGYLP